MIQTKKKIVKIKVLINIIKRLKKEKNIIVFTNGCFDLIHIGHIHLLEQAKSFGSKLVVGLNSDVSVKKIKGDKRPIVSEVERAYIIAALSCVDYVVIFNEDTPCNIISLLKPHIHVKGGDYDPNDFNKMPEAKIVKNYGGKIKSVSILDKHSTTCLINNIGVKK